MRTLILKLVCVIALAIETYYCYKFAIAPLIPIFNTVIDYGVSFQVALDSVTVNGMHVNSIVGLVARTMLIIAVWSVCISLTAKLYQVVKNVIQ